MNKPMEEVQNELEENLEDESDDINFNFLFYLNGLKYFGSIWIIATSLFIILWGFFSSSWWYTGFYALMGLGLFFVGSPILFIFCELVLLLISIHNIIVNIYEDLQEFPDIETFTPSINLVDRSLAKEKRTRRRKKS
ncbi:MAG: hypothetical protein AB1656_25865 [Candidatus Omnitrophota bacterium]